MGQCSRADRPPVFAREKPGRTSRNHVDEARLSETIGCAIELQILPAVTDMALPPAPLRIVVVPLAQSLQVIADEGHLLPGPLQIVKEKAPHQSSGSASRHLLTFACVRRTRRAGRGGVKTSGCVG